MKCYWLATAVGWPADNEEDADLPKITKLVESKPLFSCARCSVPSLVQTLFVLAHDDSSGASSTFCVVDLAFGYV